MIASRCHNVQIFRNEEATGAEIARRLRSPTITQYREWGPGFDPRVPASETCWGNLTRSSDPRCPIGSCGLLWANLPGTIPRCQRVSILPSLHQTLTIAHMVHDSSYRYSRIMRGESSNLSPICESRGVFFKKLHFHIYGKSMSLFICWPLLISIFVYIHIFVYRYIYYIVIYMYLHTYTLYYNIM